MIAVLHRSSPRPRTFFGVGPRAKLRSVLASAPRRSHAGALLCLPGWFITATAIGRAERMAVFSYSTCFSLRWYPLLCVGVGRQPYGERSSLTMRHSVWLADLREQAVSRLGGHEGSGEIAHAPRSPLSSRLTQSIGCRSDSLFCGHRARGRRQSPLRGEPTSRSDSFNSSPELHRGCSSLFFGLCIPESPPRASPAFRRLRTRALKSLRARVINLFS